MTRLKQLYFVVASTAKGTKPVRDFVGRVDDELTTATDITSFQVACGSYRVPDSPCVGLAETYYRFFTSCWKGVDRRRCCCALQPLPSQFHLREDGRRSRIHRAQYAGKTLSLIVNNAFAGNEAHEVYVYLVADQILNMKGRSGVDILD